MSRGGSSMRRVTSVMTDGQKIARNENRNIIKKFGTPLLFIHKNSVKQNAAGTFKAIMQCKYPIVITMPSCTFTNFS